MTRPSSQPMNRSELYRWVMALGFCAYDMLLYLDTHPDDAQALSYYNQCNELYNSAKKTYEERFELIEPRSNPEFQTIINLQNQDLHCIQAIYLILYYLISNFPLPPEI